MERLGERFILQGKVATLIIVEVDLPCAVSFSSFCRCCFEKITTMRFNFLKLLDRTSFPEAVRDNVVSHDVTITSSLRSNVIILGIHFLFS